MTNSVGSRSDRRESSHRFTSAPKLAAVAAAAILTAFVVLLLSLRYGGGAGRESLPGLPDAGPTDWLLPMARLACLTSIIRTLSGRLRSRGSLLL